MGEYLLDRLGWLQFERLAELALAAEAGLRELDWHDRAYRARVAWLDAPVAGLPGPVAVAVVWVREGPLESSRLSEFETQLLGLELRPGDATVVVTNLDERALGERFGSVVMVGASELSRIIDRHAEVRAALPSLLGLRDLTPLIAPGPRARSNLDVAEAQALARVFVPTRAYDRARQVLARHRFVVLTGPPEMGKTAIARMLGLAQLTTGWEVHECTSPEQVWRAFERDAPQLFVADDAFGSTEYRPDAAERWAHELGRILAALDDRHWLVWTSRPAPLRAGLRRVQRERGSERFPAPGEVLVDASDLDLAEKTLILFRHAKQHSRAGRTLVRSAALQIVEHPHFTPERIRRFVGESLAGLLDAQFLSEEKDRALATPTEAMASSFRTLGPEHRALLIALLDTPAGLTDARELTATVRRHHPAGLSRPPQELIDRLTDHFLRISSLGIDWVHPSWRDLVIDELGADPDARRRFLRLCGAHGALLVLSRAGGSAGTRALPLLVDDRDWDAFGDRVGELVRELSDQELARLLLAFADALRAPVEPARRAEALSLADYVVRALRRSWDKRPRALPVFLLEAWYPLARALPEPVGPPHVAPTWADLHPGALAFVGDRAELMRTIEWLALVQALAEHDRRTLAELGFPERERATLARLSEAMRALLADPDARALAEDVLARLAQVAPDYAARAGAPPPPQDRWWVPEDIDAPPTTERIAPSPTVFTRADVDRVLRDL